MQVLVHYPKLSKYASGRLGRFKFMPAHGRHVLDGKLLTVDEFNAISEKILGDDSLPHRPCVRLIPGEGESTGGPSIEEAKAMVDQIERLQHLLSERNQDSAVLVGELDRLRAENERLSQFIESLSKADTAPESQEPPASPPPVETAAATEPPAPAPEPSKPAKGPRKK